MHSSSSQPPTNTNIQANETNDVIATQGNLSCKYRKRIFKTARGLKQHTIRYKANVTTAEGNAAENATPRIHKTLLNNANFVEEQNDEEIIRNYRNGIEQAYERMVIWKKNLFELPKCSLGKQFIIEMTRLINECCSKSQNRDICIKELMVFPSLLLQRTSIKSKTYKVKQHLERRLNLGKNHKIEELLSECETIQSRMTNEKTKRLYTEETARRFSNLMMQGKVNPAIHLLDQNANSGVLSLTDHTMECLLQKHPKSKPKY